jgi:hypothetical protein
MSNNFASLLSDLSKTAKRVKEQPSDHTPSSKKRHRPEGSTGINDHLPADMHQLTLKVTFMCIGAQKAGTTWLYEMLDSIDGVGLAKDKEVHFWDWNRRKGLGWYSQQFPSNGIVGEITPCYMALSEEHVAEISKLFPSLKIIFIARDLVDRAWSAMAMELRNNARGLKAGQFDIPYDQMDARSRNKLERDSDPRSHPDSYFMARLNHKTHGDRSDYARALRLWLKYFPKEQLLILDYKDIAENPQRLLKQVLGHIKVAGGNELVDRLSQDLLRKRVNAAINSNQAIQPSLRRKMESCLAPFAKSFNELLKELGYDWAIDDSVTTG